MDIIIANLLFWPLWYLISNIPFIVNQYIIDNHEKVTIRSSKGLIRRNRDQHTERS